MGPKIHTRYSQCLFQWYTRKRDQGDKASFGRCQTGWTQTERNQHLITSSRCREGRTKIGRMVRPCAYGGYPGPELLIAPCGLLMLERWEELWRAFQLTPDVMPPAGPELVATPPELQILPNHPPEVPTTPTSAYCQRQSGTSTVPGSNPTLAEQSAPSLN